jgi:hypothetical protein
VPVGVSAIFVTGDVAKLKVNTIGAPYHREKKLIYVVQPNPQLYRWEPLQESVTKFLPMVWIADSGVSWGELAREYQADIRDKLSKDDSVHKLAAELTASCRTDREKIAAIASYVQRSCTYQAIEFGRRARIPNTAGQTLQRHYGDCKDHAVLAHQLLNAAGVAADLALVNSDGELIEDMPSIDQFDHMVVHVANPLSPAEPGLLIDCTDKHSDPLLSPAYGLADTSFLVLNPKEPKLIRTETYPADAARVAIHRKVRVLPAASEAASSLEVSEEVVLHPFAAPGLRSYLQSHEPADRTDAVRTYLSRNLPYAIDKLTIDGLDALDKPLVLKLSYAIPDGFDQVDSTGGVATLVGRLPASWETNWVAADETTRRISPFRILMPLRIESTTELELPDGYALPRLEQWTDSKRERFASWASRSHRDGRNLKFEYRIRIHPGHFPASDYSAYVAEMKNALSVFRRPMAMQAAAR